jgi:hypothetical protein
MNAAINHYIHQLSLGSYKELRAATKALKIIAEQNPEFLLRYLEVFTDILEQHNIKAKWNILILLSPLAPLNPHFFFQHLDLLASLAEGQSVIIRDHYVKILAALAQQEEYKSTAIPLLLDEVLKSPTNQLPSYAATTAAVIDKENRNRLKEIITIRLPDVAEYPAKTKKLKNLLQQLNKK